MSTILNPAPALINLSNILDDLIAISDNHKISIRKFSKGSFIYFPSDDVSKVYVVKKGRLKTGAYSPEGKEIIKTIAQTGDIFGEMGLLGERERGEFAQTMEVTELYTIRLKDAQELMHKDARFSLTMTQVMGQKLRIAQKRLESQVFKKAKTRIIEFLYDLGREKGQRVGFELLVKQFFTHQEIAGLTGTSRQTVTTILNELKTDNLIYFNRKRLLIRDLKALNNLIVN